MWVLGHHGRSKPRVS